MIDVVLAPREYVTWGPFMITDANLGGLISTFLLVLLVAFGMKKFTLVPTRLQVIVEGAIDVVYSRLLSAFGNDKDVRSFLPLFVSLLFFIFVANQLTLMPFMFDILWGDAALVRQPTSDLSGTIVLAALVVITANILSFRASPWGHVRTFFPLDTLFRARSFGAFFQACIDVALGLLNIIGEIAKVISLSCRLFGNIFAGNVIVLVLAGITAFTGYIVPIPFLVLSIFSGLVQAYVFTALSIEFTLGPVLGARAYREAVKN